MSTRAVEPALDSVLRCCDRRAHGLLSRRAVGVGRRAGDARFPLQALAQLVVGLSHMLAQNVSTGGLVLAEVAHGTGRRGLSARSAIAEDVAELAPFVAAGGWHEIRPHIPSAKTMRTYDREFRQIESSNSSHPTPDYAVQLRSVSPCKVLGIVLLNRVCGQVCWIRWTISSAGADDCAYVFPRGYRRERWSYQRVAGVAYQFAHELEARNIGKGDAVLLWSPNCAEWVAAFLGCALCGVIAVPIDDAASPDFARRISAQVRTRLVLCPRERAPIFEKVEGIVATIDPADLAAAVAERPAERFRPAQIQPSDPLEIVFTSGTTAEPKGVVLTHANVVGNLAPIETEIRKYLKYERLVHPIRFLNLLPLSHVFGQFLGIFLPPLLGGTVVFENTFNPTEVMATIRRERVSVLVAVPRMIESLKQKIERDLDDGAGASGRENFAARYAAAKSQHFLRRWWTFRDLRRQFGWKFWAMISGGAALDRETEEFWHRLGYAVVQGYGLTETTSLISLNHPFHTSRGSIGKVLPGREIKLADDGEILVRGSGVASGYWNGRELQPVAGDEGWYRTGDLGALDEQGNLFFKGRKKEVIVTPAGMNIYPEDLEAALRQQKEVRDCVVVGLERGGNAEPCAVLILRDRYVGRDGRHRACDRPARQRNAGRISAHAHLVRLARRRFPAQLHAETAPQRDSRCGRGEPSADKRRRTPPVRSPNC